MTTVWEAIALGMLVWGKGRQKWVEQDYLHSLAELD